MFMKTKQQEAKKEFIVRRPASFELKNSIWVQRLPEPVTDSLKDSSRLPQVFSNSQTISQDAMRCVS